MEAVTATGVSTAAAASEVAKDKLSENFDTFLNLLVAQLQNQDPLEPTNTEQFVQQLVQFSQVEQQIETNGSLEQLLDLQTSNQTASAINYLGSTVEALGNTGPLQDGRAEFGYGLDTEASASLIVISDAAGKVVHSAPGETGIGRHTYVWDGLDSNGQPMPDGHYSITVTARDPDNALIDVATSVFGRVTGVESAEDGAVLTLGNVQVLLSDVLSVKETEPAPTT
jgi:flagellar basal-body rod modification protein FlgD